jgi:hypothetical protein
VVASFGSGAIGSGWLFGMARTLARHKPRYAHPALSANGNLCQAQAAGKLLMPTEMIGQNGDEITQSTKISVTGCPRVKKAAKREAHHRAAKGKRKRS